MSQDEKEEDVATEINRLREEPADAAGLFELLVKAEARIAGLEAKFKALNEDDLELYIAERDRRESGFAQLFTERLRARPAVRGAERAFTEGHIGRKDDHLRVRLALAEQVLAELRRVVKRWHDQSGSPHPTPPRLMQRFCADEVAGVLTKWDRGET